MNVINFFQLIAALCRIDGGAIEHPSYTAFHQAECHAFYAKCVKTPYTSSIGYKTIKRCMVKRRDEMIKDGIIK